MAEQPAAYFDAGQYLLGDTAYSCCFPFILTPYKMPASTLPRNKTFNWLLAQQRIIIEHTIGILKARFPVLDGIRDRIVDEDDIMKVCSKIVSCFILHNLCIDSSDSFEVPRDQYNTQQEDNASAVDWYNEDSEDLRTCIQEIVLRSRGFHLG